jgi:hypothetical protein
MPPMTAAAFVELKERIAICGAFTPAERDFILDAVNAHRAADLLDAAPTVEVFTPPNYLGRIDRLWAFLSIDAGGEGVVAAPIGSMTVPLVAADRARVDMLIPMARALATFFGKPIRLAKFDQRTDVETYQP